MHLLESGQIISILEHWSISVLQVEPWLETTDLKNADKVFSMLEWIHMLCRKAWQLHMDEYHGTGRKSCDHCEKTFSSQKKLDRHIQHHGSRTFCSICNKSFTNDYVMQVSWTVHYKYNNYKINVHLLVALTNTYWKWEIFVYCLYEKISIQKQFDNTYANPYRCFINCFKCILLKHIYNVCYFF